MLKTLLKKQLMEAFKSNFYDEKKNKSRSTASVIGSFLILGLLLVGVLGGLFTYLSITMCEGLYASGNSWLYFAIFSGVAIALGSFGSVFNTYSGLYLGKDNDLLLSLPIPVVDIIATRLLSVYLLGTFYSLLAIVPALVVYWVEVGFSAMGLVCGILLMLIISAIILVLSCLLGWVVAKISVKVKNKSFITVVVSLVFFGAYYYFYSQANSIVQNLLMNATLYGENIRQNAGWVYTFGSIGTGDIVSAGIVLAMTAALVALTWFVLSKTFLSIATATGSTKKIKYREKKAKQKSAFGAMLAKEFLCFKSNPNYMLNCGLGILFIPVLGLFGLLKGGEYFPLIELLLAEFPGSVGICVTLIFCLLTSMIDTATPALSLEGKNVWIPKSLPIEAKTVLRAKMTAQLILSWIPMAIGVACVLPVLSGTVLYKLFVFLMPMAFTLFTALFDTFLGTKMANLSWTNAIVPIKQSGNVAIAIFGGWVFAAIIGVVYFTVGHNIGATLFLAACTAFFTLLSLLLLRWLDTRGSAIFEKL